MREVNYIVKNQYGEVFSTKNYLEAKQAGNRIIETVLTEVKETYRKTKKENKK